MKSGMQATLPLLRPGHDAEVSQRLVAFTEAACCALARMSPPRATQTLRPVFDRLTPLLSSPSDAVRRSAADVLRAITASCVTPEAVRGSLTEASSSEGSGPLAAAVAALAALLQANYHDAWPVALPVVGEMLEALGREGAPLAEVLVRRLATLCRCAQPSMIRICFLYLNFLQDITKKMDLGEASVMLSWWRCQWWGRCWRHWGGREHRWRRCW
jgi:hypothetical protein